MGNESLPQVDLAELAVRMQQVIGSLPLEGPIVGRTHLRDAAARALGCSQLQAEELVDMMVGRGILVFEREVGEAGVWQIRGT